MVTMMAIARLGAIDSTGEDHAYFERCVWKSRDPVERHRTVDYVRDDVLARSADPGLRFARATAVGLQSSPARLR